MLNLSTKTESAILYAEQWQPKPDMFRERRGGLLHSAHYTFAKPQNSSQSIEAWIVAVIQRKGEIIYVFKNVKAAQAAFNTQMRLLKFQDSNMSI